MKSKGAEFGTYNGLSYRICYGLTKDVKMDYSIPLYEFHKYCDCETCKNRFYGNSPNRFPVNSLTVSTDDKSKFQEVKDIINNYTCEANSYIGRKFITMRGEKIEEKICK